MPQRQRGPQDIDPRRAMWGGILMDIGGFIANPNQGMRGLGAQAYFNAGTHNLNAHSSRLAQQRQDTYQQQTDQQMLSILAGQTKDNRPELMQLAEFVSPGDEDAQRRFITEARLRPSSQTNITMPGQSEERLAEFFTDQYPAAFERYRAARQGMQRVDALEGLVNNIGETGVGREALSNVQSFLNTMGLGFVLDVAKDAGIVGEDVSADTGTVDLFKALTGQEVLNRLNETELYPISDADIRFLKQMNAGLSNSKRANMALLRQLRSGYEVDQAYFNSLTEAMRDGKFDVQHFIDGLKGTFDQGNLGGQMTQDVGVNSLFQETDAMLDELGL